MAAPARMSMGIRGFLVKPSAGDWLLAGAFTLAAELEVLIRVPDVSWQRELNASAALALIGLAWWRRQPLLPVVLLAIAGVASVAAGARLPMGVPQLALFLAMYALGAHAGNLELGVGAILPAAMTIAIDSLLPSPLVPRLSGLFWYVVFVTATPVFIGRLVRGRSRLVAELEKQRTALLAEREARARRAVTVERQRISRQLHRVVIRTVDSLIADVAVAETNREEKGLAAVVRIESVARKALGEMRRLLAALRLEDRGTLSTPFEFPATPGLISTTALDQTGTRAGKLSAALAAAPWPLLLATLTLVWFEAGIQSLAPSHSSRLLIGASLIAIAAPIAWSRTRPLAAAATCLFAVAAISRLLIPIPISGASAVLALYLPFSIGAFRGRREALVGLGVCFIGFIGAYGLHAWPVLVILVGAWLAGRLLGDRTRLVRELKAANRSLAEERDRRAHELVLEERLRVARDLHDVIGHTLTVVVLQAGAARRNWAADSVRVSRAIVSLAAVAREGLTELLASLKALEHNSSPPPAIMGLANIDALIVEARAAGVRVHLSMESLPAGVGQELELTAYRIVQEALTNVMKHAPRCATDVRIQARSGRLEVEVCNGGPLPLRRGSRSQGGQGLQGMAQRVAAGGGELSWGQDEVGGFSVRARLPIPV
jgi:signal transduction histidine kinase